MIDALDVQGHALQSQQYFENALGLLQQGEAGKAGELLWGSVAQAFQALAVSLNREVKTHRDLKNFAIQLSRDTRDDSIRTNFILAENLHFRFYDIEQNVEDIALVPPAVEELRQKALGLIPPELLEQRASV